MKVAANKWLLDDPIKIFKIKNNHPDIPYKSSILSTRYAM